MNNNFNWKATSKVEDELNIDSDISNLNNDNSFFPIKEEQEPLSEKEKKEIRIKIFFSFIIVFIVLIGLIMVLIFNPFKKEKKPVETNELKEDINNEKKSINELEDGDISLNNQELNHLLNEIIYKEYDYYENDTISLYKNDNDHINNISDKDKLFLTAKTNDFRILVNNKIKNNNICQNAIIISKNEIDNILQNRFNTHLMVYESFTYNVYDNNSLFFKTLNFVYENDQYISSCYTLNENIFTSVKQNVISATKEKDKLYIDVKVVFINENKIYKDPNFATLITEDNQEDYFEKANIYRYTYDITKTTCNLLSVSLKNRHEAYFFFFKISTAPFYI